ncbi:MAG: hypothetical protein ACKPKO_10235, partial [Candidatus Fonsibacter sp.]
MVLTFISNFNVEAWDILPPLPPPDMSASVEVLSLGVKPPDAPPLTDSESEPDTAAALEQPGLLWPPRILDGYPCPWLTYSDQPELDSGIRLAKATVPTPEDLALIEDVDNKIPEVFSKAL